MLRSREIELIAGLVEGTLEDESEARALLDRSEEARTEYENQRLSFETLRAAGPAAMSDSERATIRREIWTELRRDPAPVRRSTPLAYRLAPFAAALILVVGVLAILNQGFGGGEESAGTLADSAGVLSAATTEAASSDMLQSAGDDADQPAAEGDGGADMADEALPEAMAPEVFFSTITDLVRTGGFSTSSRLLRDFAGETVLGELTNCVESAGLVGYEILGEATNIEGETGSAAFTDYLVLIPEGVVVGPDTEITFVSVGACEVVHVEE